MPAIALVVFGFIVALHVWMLFSKPNTSLEHVSVPVPEQSMALRESQLRMSPTVPEAPIAPEAPSPAFSSPPPYKPFPRKIWQTSKTGPAGLDDIDRAALRTWMKLNQKWRYESVTQYGAESYVRERFADRPELVEAFTDLQDPILRADFIRYLVLLGDGGVYSDLDTRALKPIDDWIPVEHRRATNVVVGVEYDRLAGMRWGDWTLDLQFATWAILAKPGHALLQLTVQKVIEGLHRLAIKQGTTLAGVRPSFQEVLDTTGPALFTTAVFERLSWTTGTNFTWLNVTDMKAPRLIDDVLILPITAFGNGQGHSNAGSPDEDVALVQHLFKGSWKGDHPMAAADEEEAQRIEAEKAEQLRQENAAMNEIEVVEEMQIAPVPRPEEDIGSSTARVEQNGLQDEPGASEGDKEEEKLYAGPKVDGIDYTKVPDDRWRDGQESWGKR